MISNGCNNAFGYCAPQALKVSTDGFCGPNHANTYCPHNQCCSSAGVCDTVQSSCGAGCQPAFGLCSATITPTAVPSTTPLPSNIGTNWNQISPFTNCINPKHVALTFDDGPDPSIIAQVMAAAKAQTPPIPLTFFEIGNNVLANPGVSATVAGTSGFFVADHTMDHPSAIGMFDTDIYNEASQCAAALKTANGKNVQYFRPPYGEYTPASMKVWNGLGLFVISWSITSNDFADPANGAAALANVQAGLAAAPGVGHIVLCHDIHTACLSVFPSIVSTFQQAGYTFVDLQTCTGVAPYKP